MKRESSWPKTIMTQSQDFRQISLKCKPSSGKSSRFRHSLVHSGPMANPNPFLVQNPDPKKIVVFGSGSYVPSVLFLVIVKDFPRPSRLMKVVVPILASPPSFGFLSALKSILELYIISCFSFYWSVHCASFRRDRSSVEVNTSTPIAPFLPLFAFREILLLFISGFSQGMAQRWLTKWV